LAERLRGLSTSISTTKSEHVDFQLVPIPAKNQIQIKTNIPETTEVQWSICDVAGKIMTTNPTSRTIDNAKVNVSFNISNLKSGVYFVNASNKNFSKSMKFIIQN
jgi:hypothetical protein